MTMERKKSKFLYDFLPGATFNHSETNLSGLIGYINQDYDDRGQPITPNLPSQYIFRRVKRHASKWDNWEQMNFNETAIDIIQPGSANFEVFPRVFACGNCGTANQFHYNDIKDFTGAGNTINCERCGDALHDHHQMRFAAVCSCGQIQDILVPDHCGAGMEFRESGVKLSDSYWRCTNPGCDVTEDFHGGKCLNSACDRNDLRTLPHSASTTFYPQTQTLVNVRQDLDTLHTNDRFQVEIVSDYLLDDSELGEPDPDAVMDLAMDLLQQGDAESNEEARKMAKERLEVDITEHRDETAAFLRDVFDEQEQVKLSEELFEYLSITNDSYDEADYIYSYTFEELQSGAVDTHLESDQIDGYITERDRRNLSQVRLVKNFPITTVTYGYTRLSPEPTGGFGGDETPDDDAVPPALNLFRSGEWAEGQIFARTNDAEAVVLSLDKTAVREWVSENFTGELAIDDLDRWYLSQVTDPGRFGTIDPETNPVSRAVYTLLHTYSHAVIDAIGALSGYGRESLVEHLLPRTLSTVIYKRADTDYSLGSIFTLFEERFLDVMAQIEEAEFCTYDTICRTDHNCACEDCLYLSNITCANSNNNLSRSVLFGGPFDDEEINGFL